MTKWSDAPTGPQSGDTSTTEATTGNLNEGTNKDEKDGVGMAGSFNLLAVENHAGTTINDGVVISVIGGTVGGRNDIDINSRTWGHVVMAAGNVVPPDLGDDVTEGFQADEFLPGDAAGTDLGGAVNVFTGNTTAKTEIRGNTVISTPNAMALIDSHAHFETLLVQLSGGKAKNNAINGTVGVATLQHHASSLISDAASITADHLVVTSRNDAPGHIVISGGFAYGGAVGIGAGISILNVNRSSVAEIGHQFGGVASSTLGSIVANDLDLYARSTGFLTTVGLAGGVARAAGEAENTLKDDGSNSEEKTTGSGEQQNKSSGGVGLSGSVAVNNINSETRALLRASNGRISKTAEILAVDSTDTKGISGAAGITLNGGVAVAGAASINRISSTTEALVVDTDIFEGYDFNLNSSSVGRILGVSVGVALVAEDPTAGESNDDPSASIAGSFVYNEINNDTLASLQNSTLRMSARPSVIPADDESDAFDADEHANVLALAGSIGIISGSASVANLVGESANVTAGFGENSRVFVAGDVLLDANATVDTETDAIGLQAVSLGIGVGASDSYLGANTTTIDLGTGSVIDLSGLSDEFKGRLA